MNKTFVYGRLTRDPEVRQAGTKSVTSFGIANNDVKDKPLFLNCEAWDKTGELIAENFVKGDWIGLEARLKEETWDDKTDGTKRSKMLATVQSIQFGSGKGGAKNSDEVSEEVVKPKKVTKSKKSTEPDPEDDNDDDIPF